MKKLFESRSKILFICSVLATIYVIYLVIYFASSTTSGDDAEALGGAIATVLVMPYMVIMAIGAIFSWLGFAIKKNWGALTGAILYCVGLLLFPLYFIFTIPLIVLGFIGYNNQKKLTAS